jgi:hypothetical protein
MTDESNDSMRQPGVYDDDRLLASALGLDDDPELLAAAASDAALAARLDAMHAGVAQVVAQTSAAVPEPDESFTDLSGERWGGLREYFDAPPARAPRRERRWWQVVAPVAAVLVIALLIGIVAVNGGGSSGADGDSGSVAARAEADAYGAQSSGEGASKGVDTGEITINGPTLKERFVDQLDRFAVVVLARARQVSGAVQRFAVLRIFKGQAPKVVELAVGDEPADQGRLHLLMLDPNAEPEVATVPDTAGASPWPDAGSPLAGVESPLPGIDSPLTGVESAAPDAESPLPGETLAPEPIPTLAAVDGPGEPLAVSYLYNGEPTMVRELAPGTDPESVSLQIP